MLPNFLVIGAMKGGTTSLWQYLKSHPQIFLPDKKEIHFFSYDENWKKGTPWYKTFFANVPRSALAIGEASTTYAKYPLIDGVPPRIATTIPNARLIYVIRHPIDRMRSHYVDRHEAGEETKSIESALTTDDRYLNLSRYAMQIERYLDFFVRPQMLFITSEDLRDHRAPTMQRVFEFLRVDPDWNSPVFDQTFYRADSKRHYAPVAQRLRRSSTMKRVANLAPERMKKLSRTVAMRPSQPGDSTISEALKNHLEAELKDDLKKLRAYMGAGFDGWGIL